MDILLKDYIKIYNIISLQECNFIVNEIEKNMWTKHTWSTRNSITPSSFNDSNLENDEELDVSLPNLQVNLTLKKYVATAATKYFSDLNQFNPIVKAFSNIRLNRYNQNTLMKKHHDHIHTVFKSTESGIPIISVVGLLNDDFEGGKFVFFDQEEIKLQAGDILIFPSFFAYPHRVDKIIKGIRYSFVTWGY